MKKSPWILVAYCFTAFAFADPVADFINGYINSKQVPGVAVMVRQNGKVVRSEGFGVATLEHNVPVKPQTVFQSGSVGKQFTATAVMMLVEQKKIALDDPVSKYLDVPDTWKGITIRRLLTHTSGLGDYPEAFDMRKDYTEDEEFEMVTAQKLEFQPGEKWRYSNLGYVTLGILIHKVSGKFYGDFLQEHVFQPLGMNTTRIISEADIIPNRSAGYEFHDGVLKNQEWVSPTLNTTADGSLYFTVEDLAKWDEALETEKLLSHESLQLTWTPVKLNDGSTYPYGFGWGIDKTPSGHTLIEHGGAWQGFTSHIARYVDDHISVATLCNRAGADCAYIAHRVVGFYVPGIGPITHTAVPADPAILKMCEGTYRSDESNWTLKLAAEGDHLASKTNSGLTRIIRLESELQFFEEDSESVYRFEKDAKGKVVQLTYSNGDSVIKLKKIE